MLPVDRVNRSPQRDSERGRVGERAQRAIPDAVIEQHGALHRANVDGLAFHGEFDPPGGAQPHDGHLYGRSR